MAAIVANNFGRGGSCGLGGRDGPGDAAAREEWCSDATNADAAGHATTATATTTANADAADDHAPTDATHATTMDATANVAATSSLGRNGTEVIVSCRC